METPEKKILDPSEMDEQQFHDEEILALKRKALDGDTFAVEKLREIDEKKKIDELTKDLFGV